MKKIKNKILLLFVISALIVPNYNIIAEDPDDETTTPTSEIKPSNEDNTDGKDEDDNNEIETSEEEIDESKNEAYLGSLSIASGKTDVPFDNNQKFDKEKLTYSTTVISTLDSIQINAKAEKGTIDTKRSQTGIQSLKDGENVFDIIVVSENGEKEIKYTVTVKKATSNLKLKSLSIKGIPLAENFSSDKLSYTAEVSYDVKSVTIEAIPEDAECTATVGTNSSNLSVGRTKIKVSVKNLAGESKIYTVEVNRLTEEETEGNDANENAVSTSELDDEENNISTSKSDTVIAQKPNDDDKDSSDMFKTVIISIVCGLLLVISGIGIYFYAVTGNSEKNRQRKIAKLKKKQAKIELQLTGLMPVITEEQSQQYANSHSTQSVDNNKQNVELKNEKVENVEKIEKVEEKIEQKPVKIIEEVEDEEIEEPGDIFSDTIEIKIPEIKEEEQKIVNSEKTTQNVLDDFDDLFDE